MGWTLCACQEWKNPTTVFEWIVENKNYSSPKSCFDRFPPKPETLAKPESNIETTLNIKNLSADGTIVKERFKLRLASVIPVQLCMEYRDGALLKDLSICQVQNTQALWLNLTWVTVDICFAGQQTRCLSVIKTLRKIPGRERWHKWHPLHWWRVLLKLPSEGHQRVGWSKILEVRRRKCFF